MNNYLDGLERIGIVNKLRKKYRVTEAYKNLTKFPIDFN